MTQESADTSTRSTTETYSGELVARYGASCNIDETSSQAFRIVKHLQSNGDLGIIEARGFELAIFAVL